MEQQAQVFSLTDMTGDDIQAIMNGLNELPAKSSRNTMNKVEGQIIAQLQAAQAKALAQTEAQSNSASKESGK